MSQNMIPFRTVKHYRANCTFRMGCWPGKYVKVFKLALLILLEPKYLLTNFETWDCCTKCWNWRGRGSVSSSVSSSPPPLLPQLPPCIDWWSSCRVVMTVVIVLSSVVTELEKLIRGLYMIFQFATAGCMLSSFKSWLPAIVCKWLLHCLASSLLGFFLICTHFIVWHFTLSNFILYLLCYCYSA